MSIFSFSVVMLFATVAGTEEVLFALPVEAVKVGGEIGRRIDLTIYNNVMVMDIDNDFLKPFKEKKWNDGYIGIGKTIDALARFAKYTNDPKVIARKEHVVKTILKTQEEDGYIGIIKPENRVWKLWDVHELSYTITGLLTDYRLFGNVDVLEGAKKAGDYLIRNMTPYPGRIPGDGDICWEMGTTCLETAMLSLYEDTKDKKYLDFVKDYMQLDQWDGPIVKGRWGMVKGHAYAHSKRCMAKMQLGKIEKNEDMFLPARKVNNFLLNKYGLVITGTCGQHECWHDTQEGSANLGETCATAYLIRWWDDWLKITANSRFGDLIERSIYNALFGAQSPDGRKIRYYTPFEGERYYFDSDSYCCPCNYRRIIAELPQMIYYIDNKDIYVNLYTQSNAQLELSGTKIEIQQETEYPTNGKVKINLDISEPKEFTVCLRVPIWCKNMNVRVDGNEWTGEKPVAGSWYKIQKQWEGKEIIEVEMEMKPRFIRGVQAQAGRVAIMYGPQVFCVSRKSNPELKDKDLRLITIDPKTLEGPFPDDTVRKGGLKFTVKGWNTLSWYPLTKYDYENIVLTEFPDPDGEMTYLHLPNPEDPLIENDEIFGLDIGWGSI